MFADAIAATVTQSVPTHLADTAVIALTIGDTTRVELNTTSNDDFVAAVARSSVCAGVTSCAISAEASRRRRQLAADGCPYANTTLLIQRSYEYAANSDKFSLVASPVGSRLLTALKNASAPGCSPELTSAAKLQVDASPIFRL